MRKCFSFRSFCSDLVLLYACPLPSRHLDSTETQLKVKFRQLGLIFGTIRTETRAQTCSGRTAAGSVITTSAFLRHGSLQLAGSFVVARMMSYDRISSSLAVAEGTRTHPFLLGFLPTFLELTL
jgi:hypothetical protein